MAGDNSARDDPPAAVDPGGTRKVPVFSAVYAEYFDFVWSCTRRLGVRAEAMDDVVQEVFVVISVRLKTLEQPEALRSWIYGVVRRTVSMHHRSRRVRETAGETLSVGTELEARPPTPLERAEQTEKVKLLESLLDELDDAKREVFVLAELQEMTVPEIAEALGIPINTVYSRLRAARRAFDEALARRTARREPGGRPCRT